MIRIFLPLICAALGFAAASCSQSEDPLATAEAPAPQHPTSHGAASAAMASPSDSPRAHGTGSSALADQASSGAPQPAAPPPAASQPAATPPGSSQPAATPPGAPQPGAGPSSETPADQVPQDQVPSLDEPAPPSTSRASASTSTAEATPDVPPGSTAERRASTLIGMPVVSADGSPLGDVKDIIFDQQGRATHLVIAYGTAPDAAPGDTTDAGKAAQSPNGKLTALPWDAAAASIKDGHMVLDVAKLQEAPSFTPQAWPNLDDPAWAGTADAYWRKAIRAAIAAHPGAPIDSTTRQRARRTRDGE